MHRAQYDRMRKASLRRAEAEARRPAKAHFIGILRELRPEHVMDVWDADSLGFHFAACTCGWSIQSVDAGARDESADCHRALHGGTWKADW